MDAPFSTNPYTKDSNGVVTGLTNGLNPIPLSIQSPVASLKLLPNPGSGNQAGDAINGVIFNSQIAAAGAFYGVRLIYMNYDTSNTMDIDGAKVAPSVATAGLGGSANNSALTFSAFVKFAGSQTVSVPLAVTGAGGQVIPGITVSDFMPVTSLARTDVAGKPPLLRIATHLAPSVNQSVHPSYSGVNYPNFNILAANPGFNYGSNNFSGTLATLTSVAQPTFDIYGGPQNPIAAIFYYSTGKQNIAFFGDSIIQGSGSTTSYAGCPEYVAFQSYTAGTGYVCDNYATSGQTTVDTLAVLKAVLAKYQPKYAAFKAWSPNDGYTQAIANTSWGYALEAIAYCISIGVTPIVLTSPPASGATWSILQAQNARVMALPNSVYKVDIATLLNDPASPGNLLAAYDSGDHTHPNDAGHQAIATLFLASIKA